MEQSIAVELPLHSLASQRADDDDPDQAQLSTSVDTSVPLSVFRIKITGYRLLSIVLVVSFVAAKAIKSDQREAWIPPTLDWILGVVITVR